MHVIRLLRKNSGAILPLERLPAHLLAGNLVLVEENLIILGHGLVAEDQAKDPGASG